MSRFVDRRRFLFEAGGGLSGLGLTSLLGQDNLLAAPESSCVGGAAVASPFSPKVLPYSASS